MKGIDNINKLITVVLISFFNFSFLYKSISYNKLFKVLRELIDFCFKTNKDNFITPDKYCATWTKQEKEYSVIFTKATLKKCITFVLSN